MEILRCQDVPIYDLDKVRALREEMRLVLLSRARPLLSVQEDILRTDTIQGLKDIQSFLVDLVENQKTPLGEILTYCFQDATTEVEGGMSFPNTCFENPCMMMRTEFRHVLGRFVIHYKEVDEEGYQDKATELNDLLDYQLKVIGHRKRGFNDKSALRQIETEAWLQFLELDMGN